jgi:hypothetical protein
MKGNFMQLIKVESDQITLPPEVFRELKGKEIRFLRYQDGFVMKPFPNLPAEKDKFSRLARLKPRRLINGDPDDLVDIKVGEWTGTDNL